MQKMISRRIVGLRDSDPGLAALGFLHGEKVPATRSAGPWRFHPGSWRYRLEDHH
jgi:hypothetical protein